jgi:shikimate kinase / 3-dehydroquinate synthase
MDVVLVGLPGSGKTSVGRRLASRHGARFIDLDAEIEREAGATIAEIFRVEGEAGFRRRDRVAVEALGPPDAATAVSRVIATGGGTVIDPRSRWNLYRGRRPIWLDGRPEVLTQRLRRSPNVRPLIAGHDPLRTVRDLAAGRERYYAAAPRVNGVAEIGAVVDAADAVATAPRSEGAVLLRAETTVGALVIGSGILGFEVAARLGRLGARRAVVLSEPEAFAAVGRPLGEALAAAGLPVEIVLLPAGEAAKTLAVAEAVARQLARLHVERGEPLVAVGGGALTDAAGFVAATYLRGVPMILVPTTLAGQIDAAIGGKSAVNLAEGKNLVGAFHQPDAVITDVDVLASLPARQRRAALAEAVKMALLGDERLFALLEADGESIAAGEEAAYESGALAELVERAAWAKVEVVVDDEREAEGRIALNLGHSLGHALEAATSYATLLHGEAVAYGLRAAIRIGVERGVTPPDRADRAEALLDRLELGIAPLSVALDEVVTALGTDKKHRDGHLRWVLPTAAGHLVDPDVPEVLVRSVATTVLAGRSAVGTGAPA